MEVNSSESPSKTPIFEECPQKAKIIIIGDSGVGKTSILGRLVENGFIERQMPTMGVDFKKKIVTCPDQNKINCIFWDVSGEERFSALVSSFYRSSDAVVYVYDVTNYQSFKNLDNWIQIFDNSTKQPEFKMLLGNKSESYGKVVPSEKASQFAYKHDQMLFSEVSAKNGSKILESFQNLAEIIQRSQPTPEFSEVELFEIEDKFQEKSSIWCCKKFW